MRFAALLSLVVLTLACTPKPELTEGPYYADGFSDGCRTAEARRAAFDNRSFRNDELFETQASYRTGWRSGFAECQPPQIDGVNPTDPGMSRTLP